MYHGYGQTNQAVNGDTGGEIENMDIVGIAGRIILK